MQFLTLTSGQAFNMGKGRNWRVVHPDMGASWITLNHAQHEIGNEFVQHIHDGSDDIIVVLDGSVSLRQGKAYTRAVAGEAIMIPMGEVHGTVNTGDRMARMISFQSPPDMALYRGERNKEQDELPEPPTDFASRTLVARMSSGGPDLRKTCDWRRVFRPANGSLRMGLDYGRLEPSQSVELVEEGIEGVLVVLGGDAVLQRKGSESVRLKDEDLLFLERGEAFRLVCGGKSCDLIHCFALPEGGSA